MGSWEWRLFCNTEKWTKHQVIAKDPHLQVLSMSWTLSHCINVLQKSSHINMSVSILD